MLETTPTATRYYIDDVLVRTDAEAFSFDFLYMTLTGPSWRPAWSTNFDDFNFTEYTPTTDLEAVSFAYKPALGGLEYTYAVNDADLPQAANAAVYWASGPNWDDRIGGPVVQAPLEPQQGTHGPEFFPKKSLTPPPHGATHLLLALDPTNQITETDEANNVQAISIYGTARMGSPNFAPPSVPAPGANDAPSARRVTPPTALRSTATVAPPTEWGAPQKPVQFTAVQAPDLSEGDPFVLHGVW
jgi:hypothetical protein